MCCKLCGKSFLPDKNKQTIQSILLKPNEPFPWFCCNFHCKIPQIEEWGGGGDYYIILNKSALSGLNMTSRPRAGAEAKLNALIDFISLCIARSVLPT